MLQREYLTQQEVADMFRVTPSTIKNWREQGRLTYFRVPGSSRVLYPADGIEAFKKHHKIPKKEVQRKETFPKDIQHGASANPTKEWRI